MQVHRPPELEYHAECGAIRVLFRRINQGSILTITPEGKHSKSGNLNQAKPGGIYLAWKAGVPILPVAIRGCEDSVVKDRLKHFNRLHIEVVAGPSFMLASIAGKDRDALMQHYNNEVMCRIAALLPEARGGFYAGYPRLKKVLAN